MVVGGVAGAAGGAAGKGAASAASKAVPGGPATPTAGKLPTPGATSVPGMNVAVSAGQKKAASVATDRAADKAIKKSSANAATKTNLGGNQGKDALNSAINKNPASRNVDLNKNDWSSPKAKPSSQAPGADKKNLPTSQSPNRGVDPNRLNSPNAGGKPPVPGQEGSGIQNKDLGQAELKAKDANKKALPGEQLKSGGDYLKAAADGGIDGVSADPKKKRGRDYLKDRVQELISDPTSYVGGGAGAVKNLGFMAVRDGAKASVRMAKVAAGSAAVIITLVLFGVNIGAGSAGIVAGAGAAAADDTCSADYASGGTDTASGIIEGLNEKQVANAQLVINAVADRGLPQKAAIVALATVMQESGLKNYANSSVPESLDVPHEAVGSDHDSVGIFQQRYPMWGTLDVLMDPYKSTGLFLDRLVNVEGWEDMPVTRAAQKVQRSAYPDAYAKHEAIATLIVSKLKPQSGEYGTAPDPTSAGCGEETVIADGDWISPVRVGSATSSGFGPRGTVCGSQGCSSSVHAGLDLLQGCGSDIFAASAGTVRIAQGPYGGYGNAVVIDHPDGVSTLYGHMKNGSLAVTKGEQVKAGQKLGEEGDTGRSFGCHLHFETHVNGTAVNPVPFMADRGVAF